MSQVKHDGPGMGVMGDVCWMSHTFAAFFAFSAASFLILFSVSIFFAWSATCRSALEHDSYAADVVEMLQ